MLELLIMGAIVGILSGLFGIGGGIILVPILKYYYQLQLNVPIDLTMQMAVATSLTIIIFTTGSASYNYIKKNQVNFQIFYHMIPGSCVGILIGTLTAHLINEKTYAKLFSILLIVVGIKLLVPKLKKIPDNAGIETEIKHEINLQFYLFSMISGMISALFGIGGGIINTPYFLHLKLNMQKAVGTNTLCCVPAAIIGATIYALSRYSIASNLNLDYTTGLIHWPTVINIAITGVIFAPLGVKIALIIKPNRLKQMFGIVLLISALKMFFK